MEEALLAEEPLLVEVALVVDFFGGMVGGRAERLGGGSWCGWL